jgi:hypothetical protein
MFVVFRSESRQQILARRCHQRPSRLGTALALTIAGWATLAITACGLAGDPDERVFLGKKPDLFEMKYLTLATQIESEKPCYLISRNSISTAPLNPAGVRASYIRSDCFTDVASIVGREELCSHVSSVSTFLYSGHKLNRERCVDLAKSGNRNRAGGDVDRQAMFELAGFTETDVQDLLRKHEISPNGTYCLLYSREFFAAIENLPNFAGEDDLEKMKTVEWRPHQLLTLQGFPCTGKFLHQ